MKSKKLVAVLLVIVMGISQFSIALADKKSDAEQKKKEAEANLKSKQNEINRIEEQQQELRGEINKLDAELVNVMIELSTLEEELAVKQDELEQTKADLEQAKVDEKNQYEAMKLRIRFMYEKGNSTMLTSILESGSIADLLNRVEYVNEVYKYDRELLTEYQNTKDQVAMLEQQQEEEIQTLEVKQQEFQVAKENYETTIAQKENEVENFKGMMEEARSLAARYQDTINAQNTIIAQENERIERERRAAEQAAAAAAAAAANRNNNTSGGGGSGNSASSGSTADNTGGGGNKNPAFSTGVSGSAVVNYALTFVGNPYVWGGSNPNTSFDCSGFVSWALTQSGVCNTGRLGAQGLYNISTPVSSANARPGDLIFFIGTYDTPGVSHVGIYVGGGKMLHCGDPIQYADINTSYWQSHFYAFGRPPYN